MSRRLALAGALVLTACAPQQKLTPRVAFAEPDRTTTSTTEAASAATTTAPPGRLSPARASRSAARRRDSAGQAAGGIQPADIWDRLAECESGNRNDLGAPFYGYWQFDDRTFHGLGYTGHASDYPRSVQLNAAQRLHALRGWQPWPGCSRKLGLA